MRKLMRLGFGFLIIMIFITGCSGFDTLLKEETKHEFEEILKQITLEASVNEYTIYGRFLNIKGELALETDNLVLVMKSKDFETEYNLELETKNGKTYFQLAKVINQGINLDNLTQGEYVILLKSKKEDEIKYYTLKNKTTYQDLEYYTTTKKGKNNKITLDFSKFQNYNYLYLECKETTLPKEIYDLVIDPGHGGVDVGASKNGHYESHINLEYALSLKKALEKVGLKVKLTREDDRSIPNYGNDGRVSIAYQTKAKLLLSIHQNSSIKNVGLGGVEIYVANNSDFEFAESLALNIQKETSSIISKNVSSKVASGVYMRTLSPSDLTEIREDAKEKGYKPYEKATLNSTYYYIIRETGGIITGAYVDSRNKEKDYNPYCNSNFGVEAYLLELGYINSSSNLEILLTEKDGYVKAISESVKEYLEI